MTRTLCGAEGPLVPGKRGGRSRYGSSFDTGPQGSEGGLSPLNESLPMRRHYVMTCWRRGSAARVVGTVGPGCDLPGVSRVERHRGAHLRSQVRCRSPRRCSPAAQDAGHPERTASRVQGVPGNAGSNPVASTERSAMAHAFAYNPGRSTPLPRTGRGLDEEREPPEPDVDRESPEWVGLAL
jgi:hypothetical protein